MNNAKFIKRLLSEKNSLFSLIRNKKDEIAFLEKRLEKINGLLYDYDMKESRGAGRPKKELTVPANYDPSLQWNEKVLYLLKACGGLATVNVMVDKLKQLDPHVGANVKELLTQAASRLYREGIIDANRGKPYEYKLRTE